MRRLRWYKGIIFILFLLTIFLGLNFRINFSRADVVTAPLIESRKFEMVEYAEIRNSNIRISSIDIPLSSTAWNITKIELNFTDIKLGKEIKTIEDDEDGFWDATWRGDNSIGVQINISEPTLLYGIYLKGFRSGNPTAQGFVQINGYNIGTDKPDNNIFGIISLNLTGALGWYLQEFNDPISLPNGQYYLIINGSGLNKDDKFWIAENTNNSIHTNLHKVSLDFSSTGWNLGNTGEPILYKLVQRVNISYDPEELNMTAEIDLDSYPILNGIDKGTGFLTLSEMCVPNDEILHIPININQSIELVINLTYMIKLQKTITCDGSLLVSENLDLVSNNWSVVPDIIRTNYNSSVEFRYPKNWDNLKVKRNKEDISANVTIDSINNIIFIPNNTIQMGATYEISANSPQIDFVLVFPNLQYEPGQKMDFHVEEPLLHGNYTFDLINPLGNRFHLDKKEIPLENTTFSYEIPSIQHEGNYKVYLYWNNMTDAGLQTQEFTVTIPTSTMPPAIDFQLLFTIILTLSILAISGFSSAVVLKRINRNKKDRQQKTIHRVKDVLNLYYIIVTDKNSGLAVFDRLFAGKNIDSSLITGFLQAIRAFGIELTEADNHSQTIKLDYKNLTILMSEFKGFRLIFIMRENPSPIFLDTIKTLSSEIDNKYATLFDNFEGSLNEFDGIKDLVEENLRLSLLYPFKIIHQNININSNEKTIVDRASSMMKANNTDHFFIFNLLSFKKGFQAEDIEIVLNLIKKNIFQPLK